MRTQEECFQLDFTRHCRFSLGTPISACTLFKLWSNESNSWWELIVCMRVFSTLMPRSNENKSCMRIDKSWMDITARVAKTHQNLKQFKVDESWRSFASESCNSSILSSFDRGFRICIYSMQYVIKIKLFCSIVYSWFLP
jgi:hypothetical protein